MNKRKLRRVAIVALALMRIVPAMVAIFLTLVPF